MVVIAAECDRHPDVDLTPKALTQLLYTETFRAYHGLDEGDRIWRRCGEKRRAPLWRQTNAE